MKLNLWQWLGVAILVVAVVLYARRNIGPEPTGGATSQPAAK